MATLTTLFSVLLPSWVETPRTHEYVPCDDYWAYMMLRTAYNPNNAGKTTFENMTNNGCFYHNVFDSSFIGSLYMWERGYGKIVHSTAERDLACRGAKTSEQILQPFPTCRYFIPLSTFI